MCRQKGNSHIKYLQSTHFFPLYFKFLHFPSFYPLRGGAALRRPSFICRSEVRAKRRQEGGGGVLTVDCDFHCFGVGRSDVVQSAAFVVPGLVPRDARDVQVFTAVVLLAWKEKEEHVQGRDSGCVAVG